MKSPTQRRTQVNYLAVVLKRFTCSAWTAAIVLASCFATISCFSIVRRKESKIFPRHSRRTTTRLLCRARHRNSMCRRWTADWMYTINTLARLLFRSCHRSSICRQSSADWLYAMDTFTRLLFRARHRDGQCSFWAADWVHRGQVLEEEDSLGSSSNARSPCLLFMDCHAARALPRASAKLAHSCTHGGIDSVLHNVQPRESSKVLHPSSHTCLSLMLESSNPYICLSHCRFSSIPVYLCISSLFLPPIERKA